ncbi:MAG: hypothetical protein HY671_11160 [Chloroflexi bacterium]|nr:hypothetical protein [Chloroflexota bacterium]
MNALEDDKEHVAIVLHSGSYDRVSYALSLATAALATGMGAHILLTYGGLKRFVEGHLEDMDKETDGGLSEAIGRGLASGGIQSIEAQLDNARKLGLKIYACANAMANMNKEVDEVMGLVTFMKFARTATIDWYI